MERRPQQRTRGEDAPVAAVAPLAPSLVSAAGPMTAEAVIALQQSAGNAKVATALARCAAERAAGRPDPPATPPSPSALLRSVLRCGPALRRATLARVYTHWGEFTTEQYVTVQDKDLEGNTQIGMRGADIKLIFKPGVEVVDARLIGFVQTKQSVMGGKLRTDSRSTGKAGARNLPDRPGETDEGTSIDRKEPFNNPVYGIGGEKSADLDDANVRRDVTKPGFRFLDPATNNLAEQDAWMVDRARLADAAKDSRQIFETAALVTRGKQEGTYLGSVRWGWVTDANERHTLVEPERISNGAPTSGFLKAGELWDRGRTEKRVPHVHLPHKEVQFTTEDFTVYPSAGEPVVVPAHTRIVIKPPPDKKGKSRTVEVVDGPLVGTVGKVEEAQWGRWKDERA